MVSLPKFAALALAITLVLADSASAQTRRPRPKIPVDILILDGTLYDGTGSPGRRADIGIVGDRIVFVGNARAARIEPQQLLDATGLAVAPGFIDPHTHSLSDLTSSDRTTRRALNHLSQGVTTVFVGNDGDGAPNVERLMRRIGENGPGVNVAAFVGFGAVRKAVIGEESRAPTEDELVRMRGLVARAMCEGALGFSTGLYYAPQSFAQTDEVIALAREAARRGGVYETHMRSESAAGVGEALEEALRIGREADLPVHIAHIKAMGGEGERSGAMIERIEAEGAQGRRVTADQYPWTASGTRISNALMPRWTQDGGTTAMHARLSDPALDARLRAEIADNIRGRGGPDSMLITSGTHRGRRLGEAAAAMGVDPVEAARRIALEGDARIASFNINELDIRAFMRRRWVVTSSDATLGHPRRFGSFAMKYARYVREEELLTIPQFVHRSSGLTAELFGLAERGFLREGHFADIVVFDPQSFAARATYEEPELYAEGVRLVLVNGQYALDGASEGALAGRGLAKTPPPGTCS